MEEELLFVGEQTVTRVGEATWLEQAVGLDSVDAIGFAFGENLLGSHLNVELGGEEFVIILWKDL